MSNKVKNWLTYLKERSPLGALAFIAAGAAVSGMLSVGSLDYVVLACSIVFTTLILIQMRLGDEIKDFEKDKIIHPERPLPRGLLSVKEVTQALYAVMAVLLIASLVLAKFYSYVGAGSLALASIFTWLMYKEFFVGAKLARWPIVYAITHQVVVFPLYAWPTLLVNNEAFGSYPFAGWLIANFGASFSFEISRKLDPNAHALAQTYAHHYGQGWTTIFCFIFISISAFGAFLSGHQYLILPFLILQLLTLLLWLKDSTKHKLAEGFSILASAVIMWAPAIITGFNKWGLR